jgi:PAS domain S-box-containing protein
MSGQADASAHATPAHFRPEDFERMVEASAYGVIVHDAETKSILWANPTTLRVLGFTLEELLPLKAHHMSGLSELYRRSRGVDWLQRAADEGTADIEWMYRTKDGREILTEAVATRVVLGDRPVVMVQFRDIEREERTRRTLTRTETMLNLFLERMEEGVLVVDDAARVTFASASAEALLRREPGRLVEASLYGLCTPESAPALRSAVDASRQGGRSQPFRFETRSPDGESRWFSGSCQHVEEGELNGHLVLFHDVTEHVRSSQERERDLQHLNYLARFNAMGDMARTIEHEIAQPLAAASNYLAGTRRRIEAGGASEQTVLQGVDGARAQLVRTAEIMKSLRDYVLHLEQSRQRVDLNELFSEVRDLLELHAERHGVRLRVSLAEAEVPVWCERVLTGQVILNLCFNAIDEMADWPAPERVVRIETERTARGAFRGGTFRVSDTGKGLSHIPDGRIFDGAFTSKSSGHGIGLALSHQVIQRQSGEISARENEPRGAVFEFSLPDGPGDEPAATAAIPVVGGGGRPGEPG